MCLCFVPLVPPVERPPAFPDRFRAVTRASAMMLSSGGRQTWRVGGVFGLGVGVASVLIKLLQQQTQNQVPAAHGRRSLTERSQITLTNRSTEVGPSPCMKSAPEPGPYLPQRSGFGAHARAECMHACGVHVERVHAPPPACQLISTRSLPLRPHRRLSTATESNVSARPARSSMMLSSNAQSRVGGRPGSAARMTRSRSRSTMPPGRPMPRPRKRPGRMWRSAPGSRTIWGGVVGAGKVGFHGVHGCGRGCVHAMAAPVKQRACNEAGTLAPPGRSGPSAHPQTPAPPRRPPRRSARPPPAAVVPRRSGWLAAPAPVPGFPAAATAAAAAPPAVAAAGRAGARPRRPAAPVVRAGPAAPTGPHPPASASRVAS
jgi:hypothetical protein